MWDHLSVFVAVVEAGSFRGAAERLDVARSSVSRSIQALEGALGTRLLHRTTRQVAPSSAGRALYDRVAPLYVGLARAVESVHESDTEPVGTLRITSTADHAAEVLAEAIALCLRRYPRIRVETVLTNRVVDLLAEGVDIAFRSAIRELQGPGPARRIGSIALSAYTSPAWLAEHGTPEAPADLADHDLVLLRGLPVPVAGIEPRVLCDDAQFARRMLWEGAGIGILPNFLAARDVAEGRLVRVLPQWSLARGSLWMVLPGENPPPKVQVFRDIVSELVPETPR